MDQVAVGDRVSVDGYESHGVVAYVGAHKSGKKGTRVGAILDKPEGTNNGVVGGDVYFDAPDHHGVLVLLKKVHFLMAAAAWKKEHKKIERDAKRASKKEAKVAKTTPLSSDVQIGGNAEDAVKATAAQAMVEAEVHRIEEEARVAVAAANAKSKRAEDEKHAEQDAKRAEDEKTKRAVDEARAATKTALLAPKATSKPDAFKERLARLAQEKEEKKRLEEEERANVAEAAAAAKQSKKAGLAARWQPADQGVAGLSDREISARKEQRKNSKFNVFEGKGSRGSADVAATETGPARDDPTLVSYVEEASGMKTLQRRVGRGKKMAEQRVEENQESQLELEDRQHLTTGTYVEVAVWTFHNEIATKKFQALVKEITDDDRQAEGLYGVFRVDKPNAVPSDGTSDKNRRSINKPRFLTAQDDGGADAASTGGPLSTDVSFISMSVGTCQQLIELYQLFDIPDMVKPKFSTGPVTARQGIKSLEMVVFATSMPRGVQDISDKWSVLPTALCATVADRTTAIPGGWKALSKYIKRNSDEWVVLIAMVRFISAAAKTAYASTVETKNELDAIRWAVGVDDLSLTVFTVTTGRGLLDSGLWSEGPVSVVTNSVYIVGPGVHHPGMDDAVKKMTQWTETRVFVADEFDNIATH